VIFELVPVIPLQTSFDLLSTNIELLIEVGVVIKLNKLLEDVLLVNMELLIIIPPDGLLSAYIVDDSSDTEFSIKVQ
jgi:hypothetical protein